MNQNESRHCILLRQHDSITKWIKKIFSDLYKCPPLLFSKMGTTVVNSSSWYRKCNTILAYIRACRILNSAYFLQNVSWMTLLLRRPEFIKNIRWTQLAIGETRQCYCDGFASFERSGGGGNRTSPIDAVVVCTSQSNINSIEFVIDTGCLAGWHPENRFVDEMLLTHIYFFHFVSS